MAGYECICKYCAFADACPSAYFPPNKKQCADLRDMRKNSKPCSRMDGTPQKEG